jgi:hypothetical protein
VNFSFSPGVFPSVFSPVLFSAAFFVFCQVFCPMAWRRLRSHRFVMHFVGEGVGFRRRVLVIVPVFVFLISVLIVFLIVFLIAFVIAVQRFLQFLQFGGFDKRFGHGFDRLGALFRIGLRFFVLGLGKLFGKRGYFFLGEVRAIRSMHVLDHSRTAFGIQPVKLLGDFRIGGRRSGTILHRVRG